MDPDNQLPRSSCPVHALIRRQNTDKCGRELQWLHLSTPCGNTANAHEVCFGVGAVQSMYHGYKEWTGNLAYPIIREPKFGRRHLYCEKSADSNPNASSVNNQRKLLNSVLSFVQEAQILVDELTGKNSRPFFCNRQNWICWYLVVSITWRPDVWCLFIALLQSRA